MPSSMIAKAATLKPEIRLAQSLSEFESSLSDDHKALFRSSRSQSLKIPLNPSDVMRLTAEIDRRAVQQNGGGQCFGPRLTNILQAVQQYAALGDVIIGGSQNILACGIWSLLRLTLLALVSFSSYMEKLSRLLMVAGRKAPRYEQMALLYPRSSDLQTCLSEYFIVVVQLCRQLYKITQKTALGSYFSFLSDSDLKEHETGLQLWADCIKDEVTLLTARKIAEQSTYLGMLSKNSEKESHRKRLRTRLRILEACSMYDHQTTWKEIRKLGTSTILEQLDRYAEWKAETTSSTLFCLGKLGFGKSVLLANMVDELNLSMEPAGTAVLYFFCRYDIQESLRARTIIGSIARQIIDTNLIEVPDEPIDTSSVSGIDNLLAFVLRMIPKAKELILVLDGLDECEDHERNVTLCGLKRLQESFSLKICCSFRSDMHLKAAQEAAVVLLRSEVAQLPEDNPDISPFVTKELQRCIAAGRLCVGDSSLISEIEHALAHRAQGMFLWVYLQIESLCGAQSDEEIREALQDLPKGLPDTFSRILYKHRGVGDKYQKLIFKLCVAAQRPLTTEELREALSVAPFNIEWSPAHLINNIFTVLSCCGSLITVDEEDMTVRLLHHSVKQYLLGDSGPSSNPILTLEDADKAMGDAIITYLNYDEFENAVSRTVFQEIRAQDIPSGVAESVLRYSSPGLQVGMKLFQRRQLYQHDLRDTLIPQRQSTTQNIKFDFHDYAKTFWLCHVPWSLQKEPKAVSLLLRLLKKSRININDTDEQGKTLLWKVVGFASAEVVESLLDCGANIRALSENGARILHLSIIRGCDQRTIEVLLVHGATIEDKDLDGRTAVSLAALKGQTTVLESLLNTGADIETKDNTGWTPLLLAIQAEQKSATELLLSRGARIEESNGNGTTAILLAADGGHYWILNHLLEKGANIQTRDFAGWTPLLLAVQAGDMLALELLLSRGADVNARNGNGSTAVFLAADGGHRRILECLLQKGADFKSKNHSGYTPLHIATKKGYTQIQESLLDHGVNIEERNSSAMTPLILAAYAGDWHSISILLDRGAKIEAKDDNGRTALHWAAFFGYVDAIRDLVQRKADIEAKDKNGCTALHLADSQGHEPAAAILLGEHYKYKEVTCERKPELLHLAAERGDLREVKALLIAGASVRERTGDGRTALHLAAQQGHVRVVEHLLDQGAVIGLRTYMRDTAISLAVKNGHDMVVQCLLARGARYTAP